MSVNGCRPLWWRDRRAGGEGSGELGTDADCPTICFLSPFNHSRVTSGQPRQQSSTTTYVILSFFTARTLSWMLTAPCSPCPSYPWLATVPDRLVASALAPLKVHRLALDPVHRAHPRRELSAGLICPVWSWLSSAPGSGGKRQPSTGPTVLTILSARPLLAHQILWIPGIVYYTGDDEFKAKARIWGTRLNWVRTPLSPVSGRPGRDWLTALVLDFVLCAVVDLAVCLLGSMVGRVCAVYASPSLPSGDGGGHHRRRSLLDRPREAAAQVDDHVCGECWSLCTTTERSKS